MKRKLLVGALGFFLVCSHTLVSLAETNKDVESNNVENIVIPEHSVDMTQSFEISKTKLKVGEEGEIIPNTIEGIIPKGKFKEIKNDEIELNADGTFKVLKAGTISFGPEMLVSDESKDEIKGAYIKRNKLTDVLIQDIGMTVKEVYSPIVLEVSDENEKQAKKITIDLTPHFSIDKTDLTIGETTKLKVEPINGVNITGEFSLTNESELFTVEPDGVIIPKKVGNKLILLPSFQFSEQSIQEIFEAKKAELKDDSIKIEDIDFIHKDIQQMFYMNVSPFILGFVPKFHLEKTVIKVGEQTKMIVEPMFGVDMTGYSNTYKDEFIEMTADGTITGLKAGKTQILRPTFESEEIQNKVIEAYIQQEGLTNVPLDSVHLTTPENRVSIWIEVVDSSNSGNGSGSNGNSKTYAPVKKLPQTGEKSPILASVLGMFLMFGTTIVFRKKNN